jgi:hypothetical protein
MITNSNARLFLDERLPSETNWEKLWAALNDFESIKHMTIDDDFLQFTTVDKLKDFFLNFLAKSGKNHY